jgi:hypothetical protein
VTGRLAEFAMGVDACHDAVAGPVSTVGAPCGIAVASWQRLPGEPLRGVDALSWHAAPASDERTLAEFAPRLVRLQWNTVRAELDDVLDHLTQRTSKGVPLLEHELVRGAIADVALALSEAASLLDLPPAGARLWRVHLRLVSAGRTLLKLFGASGFLTDGPGGVLYLTELMGNVYLHPETEDGRD